MRSTRHQAATSISMLLLLVLSSFAGTDLLLGSVVGIPTKMAMD